MIHSKTNVNSPLLPLHVHNHTIFSQGLCKFGFYEVFKNLYSGILGEENSYLYRTSLYLAASASAEFFADIALSPMESVKVRKINRALSARRYRGYPYNFVRDI